MDKDPLHGKTLKFILQYLVDTHGWKFLGQQIKINCFKSDPSINSSLVFLRKTPWAREKVEQMYIATIRGIEAEDDPGAPIDLQL